MVTNGAGRDGRAALHEVGERPIEPAPERVHDLAEGCVRFVEKALSVRLDYEPETLPVLDHYLTQARSAAEARPEAAILLAHAAGAYFGEVVRRRYPSWWRAEGDDPGSYRIELEPVYVSFSPVELVADALRRTTFEASAASEELGERFELEDDDREAVAARLAELPPVTEDEFFTLATRLEVLDIAVDAIRARRASAGDEIDCLLGPEDYDRD